MCLFLLTSEYAVVMCSYSPWWWWIVSSRSWSSEGSSPSPHALHHGSTLLMYCEKRQIYSICIETQVQHHTNAIKTERAGQLKITIALICLRKSFLHTNNNPEVFYPDGGAYENFYGRTNTVKKRKVRHHLEKERVMVFIHKTVNNWWILILYVTYKEVLGMKDRIEKEPLSKQQLSTTNVLLLHP